MIFQTLILKTLSMALGRCTMSFQIYLPTFLAGLCNQESSFGECFYGLFSENVMSFFSTQEDLREALQIEYAAVDSKWEELDVANLEYWWCRYLDEGDNLHLISFDID